MKEEKHSISLSTFEYNILANDVMIAVCCEDVIEKAKIKDGEVKLLLTRYELEELVNSVASEANNTRSIKKEEDLDYVYGRLEAELGSFGIDSIEIE